MKLFDKINTIQDITMKLSTIGNINEVWLPILYKDNFLLYYNKQLNKLSEDYDRLKSHSYCNKINNLNWLYNLYLLKNEILSLSYVELIFIKILADISIDSKKVSVLKSEFLDNDLDYWKIDFALTNEIFHAYSKKIVSFILILLIWINLIWNNYKLSFILILWILWFFTFKYIYKYIFWVTFQLKPVAKIWLSIFMFFSFISFSPVFHNTNHNNYYDYITNYNNEILLWLYKENLHWAWIENTNDAFDNLKNYIDNDELSIVIPWEIDHSYSYITFKLKPYQTIYDIINSTIEPWITWNEREKLILIKLESFFNFNRDYLREQVARNWYNPWWLSDFELVKYLPSGVDIRLKY